MLQFGMDRLAQSSDLNCEEHSDISVGASISLLDGHTEIGPHFGKT